jgi:hypothetical protein
VCVCVCGGGGRSNINKPDFLLTHRDSCVNKITLLVVREGIPITIVIYHCMSAHLLSVLIMNV